MAKKPEFGSSLKSMRQKQNETEKTGNQSILSKFDKANKFYDSDEKHISNIIKIDNLIENPLNARCFYDDNVISELASSIIEKGQIVSVPVTPSTEKDKYIVLDGHYRLKAMLKAGINEVRCDIHDNVFGLDLYILSRAANEERSSQSVFDDAISFAKLIEKGHVKSQVDLCTKTGVSEGSMSKYLAISKIPFEIISLLVNKPTPLGLRFAYTLSTALKKMTDNEFNILVQKIVNDDWSNDMLELYLKNLSTVRTKIVNDPKAKFFNSKGKKVGQIDVKGKTITFKYTADDPELAMKLSEGIECYILDQVIKNDK